MTDGVTDACDRAMNCHRSNCRRATGAAFRPMADITDDLPQHAAWG